MTPQLSRAVEYAARMHQGHVRKGTSIPYISHPLAVGALILEAGGTEEQVIAGLLHDVPEDCGGEPRLIEIEELFGRDVAQTVRGCSDSLTEDPDAKAPWRERKEKHLEHLAIASPDVLLVTAADKTHNATALWNDIQTHGVETLRRFNATPRGIAWYYASILQVLTWRDASPYLEAKLAEAVFPIVTTIQGARAGDATALGRSDGNSTHQGAIFDRKIPFSSRHLRRSELALPYGVDIFTDSGRYQNYAYETAIALLARLPGAGAHLETRAQEWHLRISCSGMGAVAEFSSDGAFASVPNWGIMRWRDIKEGGPDSIANWLLRDINEALGRPNLENIGLSKSWLTNHITLEETTVRHATRCEKGPVDGLW